MIKVAHWLIFCAFVLLLAISACTSQSTPLSDFDSETILYLGWDENDIVQLFAVTSAQETIQLSSVTDSVQTYAISPNKAVAFTTSNALYTLSPTLPETLVFDCATTACDGLFWDSNDTLGFRYANNLLWIDPSSGETKPIFADEDVDGKNGRLSPDGHWLSYIDARYESVTLINRTTGEIVYFSGGTNTNVSWHPDGMQLITTELINFQETTSPHITHFNTITQNSIDLSTSQQFQFVSDNWPSWSPDSSTIAFIRNVPGTASGGQLWLMNSDGTNQRALTNDPAYTYGPPNWSTDQTHLLALQASVTNPAKKASIVVFNIDSKKIETVVQKGFMPHWFP